MKCPKCNGDKGQWDIGNYHWFPCDSCHETGEVDNQPKGKLQSDEMPERCQYKRIQDKGEYELFDTCHVPIELAYSAIDEFEFCPYCGKRIEVKEADNGR